MGEMLCGAVLCGVVFVLCAVLSRAVLALCCAVLCCGVLCCAFAQSIPFQHSNTRHDPTTPHSSEDTRKPNATHARITTPEVASCSPDMGVGDMGMAWVWVWARVCVRVHGAPTLRKRELLGSRGSRGSRGSAALRSLLPAIAVPCSFASPSWEHPLSRHTTQWWWWWWWWWW